MASSSVGNHRRRTSSRLPFTIAIVVILLLAAILWIVEPMMQAPETMTSTGAGTATNTETDAGAKTGVCTETVIDSKTTTESPATAASQVSIASNAIAHLEYPQMRKNRTEQVIEHLGYTVSYNSDWHLPNWVAYELTADEVDGVEERANHFKPDPLVNGDPVVTKDYSNSGYDRGHMAPAADMKWSEQAMRESFYMTNMCPQLHNLNAGDWKILEEQVRDWAADFDHIYICCGPIVTTDHQTIGTERKIVVPAAFYKVLLCEKCGSWQSIGFLMFNKAGHKALSTYAKSVDDLEISTGLDFFYQLPDSLESQVEQSFDLSVWGLK